MLNVYSTNRNLENEVKKGIKMLAIFALKVESKNLHSYN